MIPSKLAELIGDCELLLVYVVEWAPFTFQTAEENAQRHKRREEEISLAMERVVSPAVDKMKTANVSARGIVKHGDVAGTLNRTAEQESAAQIVVARSSESGIAQRVFGSSTSHLVMGANVPVTVVN